MSGENATLFLQYFIITEKTKNAIDFTKETQSRFRNDFSNTL